MESRRYRIEEVLGKGGYGVVYRATMEADGGFRRPVAMKRLLQADPEGIARFRDEARMLSHVRHSAVIQVDALLELDGSWTVVMEYVEGVDLLDVLHAYTLPPRAALELVALLARALEAAWSTEVDGRPLRLVHRDIKPGNIRLTAHGDVKLLDFGIATAALAREVKTQQGVRLGTPAYMAPERLAGRGGSPADVYALGLCLAECLGGQRNLYLGYCEEAPFTDQVRSLVAQLPVPVQGLVSQMLAFDEGGRPSVADVAQRCDALSAELGGPTLVAWASEAVESLPPSQPNLDDPLVGQHLTEGGAPRGRRRWLWAAVGLVLLGGLGVAGVSGLTAVGGAAWWVAQRPTLPERGTATMAYRTETGDVGKEVTASWDGRYIVFGLADQVVREEVATGKRLFVARDIAGLKFNLALSPDGSRLALTTLSHVYVVDVATDDRVREIQPFRSYTLEWGPRGQRLLMARDDPGNDADSFLFVYDLATDERQIVHRGGVDHATWWPEGEGVFVWPEDGAAYSVRLDGSRVGELPEGVPRGAPSPEGTWVWTEARDEGTALMEATLSPSGKLGTPRDAGVAIPGLTSLAVSSGAWFAVVHEQGPVAQRARLSPTDGRAQVEEAWEVAEDVSAIATSPGGSRAVVHAERTAVEVLGGASSDGWTSVQLLGFVDDDTLALAGIREGVEGAWQLGPDGLELLVDSVQLQAGAVDGSGRIWGHLGERVVLVSEDGMAFQGVMAESNLHVAAASPSGAHLAMQQLYRGPHGRTQGLRIVDTATGALVASWDQPVVGLVWVDDQTVLGSFDQSLTLFELGGASLAAGYGPPNLREIRDLERAEDGTVWMLGERNGNVVEVGFDGD